MSTLEQKYEYAQQPGRVLPMLVGMLVGSLAGAVTLLLFAPQPGEKTRAELKEGVSGENDREINERVLGHPFQRSETIALAGNIRVFKRLLGDSF